MSENRKLYGTPSLKYSWSGHRVESITLETFTGGSSASAALPFWAISCERRKSTPTTYSLGFCTTRARAHWKYLTVIDAQGSVPHGAWSVGSSVSGQNQFKMQRLTQKCRLLWRWTTETTMKASSLILTNFFPGTIIHLIYLVLFKVLKDTFDVTFIDRRHS